MENKEKSVETMEINGVQVYAKNETKTSDAIWILEHTDIKDVAYYAEVKDPDNGETVSCKFYWDEDTQKVKIHCVSNRGTEDNLEAETKGFTVVAALIPSVYPDRDLFENAEETILSFICGKLESHKARGLSERDRKRIKNLHYKEGLSLDALNELINRNVLLDMLGTDHLVEVGKSWAKQGREVANS